MQEGYIQKILPDTQLRGFIRQYTFVHITPGHAKHLEFKVFPSSHSRMILFFSEPSYQETHHKLQPVDRYSVAGFISKPQVFFPASSLHQVIIHFTAYGIQPFVDFPISEITDTRADLSQVFKYDLEKLTSELDRSLSLPLKAQVLDAFFKSRLHLLKPVDPRAKAITDQILRVHGVTRLQDLCATMFVGERTAQRLIHNAVGVNYKSFVRVVRLEYVRQLMTQKDITLSEITHQAGYFDQAHFIHDFQQMFNENPREFLMRQKQLIWNQIDT